MKLHFPLLFAVAVSALPHVAMADPISSCTVANLMITCNLYESDANGKTSETGSQATGRYFYTGWLVVTEGAGNNMDPDNWSDLVFFSSSTVVQVVSDPATEGFTFPITVNGKTVTAADIVNGRYDGHALQKATVYALENNYPTVFTVPNIVDKMNTINVYSDVGTPEPSTLGLLAVGIAACFFRAKTKRQAV